MHHHLFFFPVKYQENNLQIDRQTEARKREWEERGGGGGGGVRREEESSQKIFIRKKAVILILLWPPVVLVTIQQIAKEYSYSSPQLTASAVIGLRITCLHPNYRMVSDDMSD